MKNSVKIDTGSFLGRGWGFPPQFNKAECGVKMVKEEDDICESLHIILSTRMGERLLRPNFGCNLHKLLFEPINTQFITFIKSYIEQSILLHEARIRLQRVNIDTTDQLDGVLRIEITYVIRATNSPNNYVYDFFLNEALDKAPPKIQTP